MGNEVSTPESTTTLPRKKRPADAASSSAEVVVGIDQSTSRMAVPDGNSYSQQQRFISVSRNHDLPLFYDDDDDDDDDDDNNVKCSTTQQHSTLTNRAPLRNSDQGDELYVDDEDVQVVDDCKPAAAKRQRKIDSSSTAAATTMGPLASSTATTTQSHIDDDYAIAVAMQQEYDDEERQEQQRREVQKQMRCSTTGKAWQFVKSVLDLLKQMQTDDDVTISAAAAAAGDSGNPSAPPPYPKYSIQPVAVNNMVFFAERFFAAQEEFLVAGKPTIVDLGYHYTTNGNLESIRTDGLMSKKERTDNKIIEEKYHGSSYGDGIYSATHPVVYANRYGEVGLLVARLPGQNVDFGPAALTSRDSVTVKRNDRTEFMVLATAKQCLPIIQFPHGLALNGIVGGLGALKVAHCKIQSLVNATFNASTSGSSILDAHSPPSTTKTVATAPPMAPLAKQKIKPRITLHRYHTRSVQMPDVSRGTDADATPFDELLRYTAPATLTYGHMPSGTMLVRYVANVSCSGHEQTGSFVLDYKIPSGVQMPYHARPGAPHGSAHRVAYVPNTVDGRKLLKRLKYAFRHGLIFTVGVSMTTGRDNSITWASIPHKTSPTGGSRSYGFPDP